jgi:hypothetical protein
MRMVVILALAAGALAQGPPSGPGGPRRGRMEFGGPGDPRARFIGFEAGMPGRVVKNAPYSAELITESVQTLADGNRLRQSATVKVYRDGEGRTRREQSVNLNGLGSNANMPQLVFINDPVAGVNYALNARDRTGTRSAWTHGGGRGAGFGRRRGPEDANVKTESLGRQTMEGIPVDGQRVTMTIPAGRIGNDQAIPIVTETWYSPDLQTMVLSKHSDPRSGETVTRMANISRSEPARSLFEVPADYKIAEAPRRMPSTR